MSTELVINARLAQYVVQTIGRIISIFAVLQGLSIILGGKVRWSAEAFATALLLPGAPPSWGWLLSIFGLIAIAGTFARRGNMVAFGLFGCAAWSLFFAASFVVTAIQNERSALTGIWAYLLLSIISVLVGVTYRESRKLES